MTTKNLFHQFVEALGIQHTSDFTDGVFEKHPYKYTLYGISRMLDYYSKTGYRTPAPVKMEYPSYEGCVSGCAKTCMDLPELCERIEVSYS